MTVDRQLYCLLATGIAGWIVVGLHLAGVL